MSNFGKFDLAIILIIELITRPEAWPERFPGAVRPPSPGIIAPDIQSAAGDARKVTRFAMSSGRPRAEQIEFFQIL